MSDFAKKVTHFLHPHYVFNVFLSVIFFGLKSIDPFCSALFDDCHLELREWELLTFMGCIIVMKNRKTPTYSIYVETVCMFAKMLSTILFMRQNPIYGVLYIVACFLHLVFMPEPMYQGPEYVTYFRGPNLQFLGLEYGEIDTRIESVAFVLPEMRKNEIDRDKRVTWLIEFYAAWAPNCANFAPKFAELSAKYNLDNLKFGKIDVTRYPDVAKKYMIDTSSWSKQLPTVILFQNGKETRRRPAIDSKGSVVAKFIFIQENIIRDFELPEIHANCKKNPLSKRKEKCEEPIGETTDNGHVETTDDGKEKTE